MPTPLIIKTCYTTPSGVDTRRFQLNTGTRQTPYQQIITLLETHYGTQNYRLKYTDDDGDMCSIGSQLELSEAFRVFTGKVLKLEVTVAAPASSPAPSATPRPSLFPSSSASTTSSTSTSTSTIPTPPRSHVTDDDDDDHDVISLDGSISDFEPDDINRAPSPIPSDGFDPSIVSASAPASHVDDELIDDSLVMDLTTSHISSQQTAMVHVDALDVLPPVEVPVTVDVTAVPTIVEQVIIPVDVREPVIEVAATPAPAPAPAPAPSPAPVLVVDPVADVMAETHAEIPMISPSNLLEPLNPTVEQPGAQAPLTCAPVDMPVVDSLPDTIIPSSIPNIMTQSMTEQKYETPDEKHGTEWACHACTFINVPQHGQTATSW